MKTKERVSIIMPAYNSAAYISDSILSVIKQEFQDWHLYIIDDASTDDTSKIVASISDSDSRITYLCQLNNRGVATARNIGIEKCTGQYIAFLDSDDIWEPSKLKSQVSYLDQGYDVVCSHYALFINDPDNIIDVRTGPFRIDYSRMLRGNCIGNLTGIYNRRNLGKVIQKKCGHEDYLMWLELLSCSGYAICVQQVLARYRVSSNSLSANKLKAASWQWSIYRNHLKFNFIKSAYYLSCYGLNAVLKRW
ncbi:glycosyltransferase involved in cell wall biosynthesis [Buttiauxella sp. BIGb0471]|uniref:glycosyltransferase family 2 protein n=1 Tax=Buttiauxella sp. BIGb0471 TaxID=2940597 RepID=UPI0021693948|nr:glycosyltransferase family 2 protein [Buttiauxella sp. BIGb0471]MCS3601278.1 glycosyltransferase involved in cell wall biosynthesis [Buttiauxella sp. BIGb0471]